MAKKFTKNNINESLSPRRYLKATSKHISRLNHELAIQMLKLASQTGDVDALIQSAKILRKSQDQFSPENTTQESADVQMILASTLHKIAKANQDIDVLDQALAEYRTTITLASVTNNDALRVRARKDYKSARELAQEMSLNISRKQSA